MTETRSMSDFVYRLSIVVGGLLLLVLFAYLDAKFVVPFFKGVTSETGVAIIQAIPSALFVPLIGWSLWNPVLVGLLVGALSKTGWILTLVDVFLIGVLYTAFQMMLRGPFSFFQVSRFDSMSNISLYFVVLVISVALPACLTLVVKAAGKRF